MDIIKIKNLKFSYQQKKIFENLNLTIKKGTITSLIGTNGSGKTTLVKILLGLLFSEGKIIIDDIKLNENNIKQIRKKISYISEDVENYFLGITVLDNLIYNLENLCYSKQEITKKLEYITKIFKIEDILNKDKCFLTTSQKQLVNIAASLIHNPKILIIDEGLSLLNNDDLKCVLNALKTYQKEKQLTIILITHNPNLTLISDAIIVLDKGQIILNDNPINVYKNYKLLEQKGLKTPFIIKLSSILQKEQIIAKICLNQEQLVNEIWN